MIYLNRHEQFLFKHLGNENILSDSSPQQEQASPKILSSPTNAPNATKIGRVNRLSRQHSTYKSAKVLLPNKLLPNGAHQKNAANGRSSIQPSSDQVICRLCMNYRDYIYLTSKSLVNILWFYINFSLTLTLRASNF